MFINRLAYVAPLMQCPEHQPIIYILQPSCFYNNLHNHELCRNWWPRTSTILLPFMYFQIFGSIETSFLGTWVITALSWSFDFLYIIWSLGNCLFNWLFYLSISYVGISVNLYFVIADLCGKERYQTILYTGKEIPNYGSTCRCSGWRW